MNKKLNQMSSQELEELKIKISKELNNRQLSTKNGELEKIKQKFIGKYIKYVTGSSTYVGYVKDITVWYMLTLIMIVTLNFILKNMHLLMVHHLV